MLFLRTLKGFWNSSKEIRVRSGMMEDDRTHLWGFRIRVLLFLLALEVGREVREDEGPRWDRSTMSQPGHSLSDREGK